MSRLLIAPIEALSDARLTDPERRVLLALFSFRGRDTNTVWPSLKNIAELAHINDHTRISKLTKSLEGKGWLTKKKRGFTGGNEYTLTVPEMATKMDDSNLDCDANLAPDTKLAPDTNSNLDCDTNSNLDSAAKYKEQTIEHTNEHTSKTPRKPRTTITPDDLKADFPDLPDQTAHDYLDFRKRKRCPLTPSAWKTISAEVTAAKQRLGLSADQVLSEVMSAGWQGFRSEWLINRMSGGGSQEPARRRRAL